MLLTGSNEWRMDHLDWAAPGNSTSRKGAITFWKRKIQEDQGAVISKGLFSFPAV